MDSSSLITIGRSAPPTQTGIATVLRLQPPGDSRGVRWARAESCFISGKLMHVKNGSLGPNTVVNSNQNSTAAGSSSLSPALRVAISTPGGRNSPWGGVVVSLGREETPLQKWTCPPPQVPAHSAPSSSLPLWEPLRTTEGMGDDTQPTFQVQLASNASSSDAEQRLVQEYFRSLLDVGAYTRDGDVGNSSSNTYIK